jgi:hypothetical protein
MSADSEDPAELCVVACRAIRDFDTSLQQRQFGPSINDDGADDYTDDVSVTPFDLGPAATSLAAIPAFLWLAASNPKKKFPTVDFETVTAGPGATWVSACTDLHLAGGRLVSAPTQDMTSASAFQQALEAFTVSQEALTNRLSDRPDPSGSANATTKGWGKLAPRFRAMFLLASERDDSGNVRTTPVTSYLEILNASNTSVAKTIADSFLQHELKCHLRLADSTVLALRDGTLTWPGEDSPGAFTLFACGPAVRAANLFNPESDSRLSRQLAADEGHGLTESMVNRMAKVIHQMPRTIDHLASHLRGGDGLLQVMWGPDSAARQEIASWLAHVSDNRLAYEASVDDDPLFPTKLLFHIDRVLQGFIAKCFDTSASSRARERTLARFNTDRENIIYGQLLIQRLPKYFAVALLQRYKADGQIIPPALRTAADDGSLKRARTDDRGGSDARPRSDNTDSQFVFNTRLHPLIKRLQGREISALFRRLTTAPPMSDNRTICLKFHLKGKCLVVGCDRDYSHGPLDAATGSALVSWATSP